MIDGLYQSVILFYMAYLAFLPGNFVTHNGLNIDDRERFGVYIAPAAIIVINTYILLNTYRWDWLMLLLVIISSLLVWFWTGVYSAFKSSDYFYKAATEVFAQPTFWAVTCLSIVLSLAPRFFVKAIQKIYFPYDVDIIREQVRKGELDISLNGYRVAQNITWRRWMRIVFDLTSDKHELQAVLDRSARSIGDYTDAALAILSRFIDAERAELAKGAPALQREVLQQV